MLSNIIKTPPNPTAEQIGEAIGKALTPQSSGDQVLYEVNAFKNGEAFTHRFNTQRDGVVMLESITFWGDKLKPTEY